MDMPLNDPEGLSRDVEALRDRFTNTRELYREVCALLFFRYGVTPTANRLYQLVRKGSMSAPSDALARFWADLREKSRTRIEHPDLPDALKSAAGELVAQLWLDAQSAAQASLTTYREEAQEAVLQAKADVLSAHAQRDAQQSAAQSISNELEQAQQQITDLRERLAVAQAAHASSLATLDEQKQDNAALERRLEERHREFGVELEKLRSAMQLAEERTRSTEKRMLLDVDRERTTSARLQKELDTLTAKSMQAAEQHHRAIATLQQTLSDSRHRNGELEGALKVAVGNLDQARLATEQLRTELSDAVTDSRLLQNQLQECQQRLKEASAKKSRKTAQPPTRQSRRLKTS